jgi:hypothetical protein
MLFVSSLDLIMLSIGNVICDDKKQHVSKAQEASSGFSSRLRIYGFGFFMLLERKIFLALFLESFCVLFCILFLEFTISL